MLFLALMVSQSEQDASTVQAVQALAERFAQDVGAVGPEYSNYRANLAYYVGQAPRQALLSWESTGLRSSAVLSNRVDVPWRVQTKLWRELDAPYTNADIGQKIARDAAAVAEAVREVQQLNSENAPVRFFVGGGYARGRVGPHSDVDLFFDTTSPELLEKVRVRFAKRAIGKTTPVRLAAYHRNLYLWGAFTPFVDVGDGARFLNTPESAWKDFVAERQAASVQDVPPPIVRLLNEATEGKIDIERVEGIDLLVRLSQLEGSAEGETKEVLREAREWLAVQSPSVVERLDRPLVKPIGPPEPRELTQRIQDVTDFLSTLEYFRSKGMVVPKPEPKPEPKPQKRAPGSEWRLHHEVGATGMFVAAYLTKEAMKAIASGDLDHMKQAASQVGTLRFWGELGLFTGAARGAEWGLTRLHAGSLIRLSLPLAAGMTAVSVASGRFRAWDIVLDTGAYVMSGIIVDTFFPALVAATPHGKIATAIYSVGKLALVLYGGEILSTLMEGPMTRPRPADAESKRAGAAQKVGALGER